MTRRCHIKRTVNGETINNQNDIRKRGKFLMVIACFAIFVAGGLTYLIWQRSPVPGRSRRPPSPVPVSLAVAHRQNVSIYVTGLGTVQASSTVAIHSQVDGKLQEVLFTEEQHVKKGEVLARIDPRLFQAALDQARAKKAQDAALLVAARKNLARFETLARSGFQTPQTVDQQQATVDQLKASIAADDAAIETAQTQLDYTTITAPSDGRIGFRQIDPGNIVHASDAQPIALLMRIRPCAVLFTLPSRVLEEVRDALARGPVEVTALDQDNRRALSTGRLLLVGDAIDPANDAIRLKAIFANKDERLWPGEFVNARLLIETLRNALVVPSTAVQRGPRGLFTWIVTAKDTAEPRPITVGPTASGQTVITSGLRGGERVVTDGQYKLKRDAPVKITSPPSSMSGGPK